MPDSAKLAYLRKLRAAGATTDAERAELDHAGNVYGDRWWMHSRDRTWFATADELAAFRTAHGRWPVQLSADRRESQLAHWLRSQRRGVDKLPTGRREYLGHVLPRWDDQQVKGRPRGSVNADHMGAAQAFAAFVEEHGTWPSKSTGDTAQVRLRRWRDSQRRRRQLHPERADPAWAYLDEHAPGWDTAGHPGRPKRTE